MPPKFVPIPKSGHRREEGKTPGADLDRKRATPGVLPNTGRPAKRLRSNSEVDGRPNDDTLGVIHDQVKTLAERVQQDLQRIVRVIAQGQAEEGSKLMEGVFFEGRDFGKRN